MKLGIQRTNRDLSAELSHQAIECGAMSPLPVGALNALTVDGGQGGLPRTRRNQIPSATTTKEGTMKISRTN